MTVKYLVKSECVDTNNTVLEGLRMSHTARYHGYVSRNKPDGIMKPYKGRFGTGWTVFTPAYDSTRWCFVTYYIEEVEI